MKIICNGTELSDALNKVVKAMPVKKTLPILEGINLKTAGDILVISATDLNLYIQKRINADVLIDGEIVVPGKFFSEFIRKINCDQITLDATDDAKLKISYGENETFVNLLNVDEFPPFEMASEDVTFNMKKKDMKELVNKVSFAVATDDSRPMLKGCCLDVTKNLVTAVASDGYRLALVNKSIDYNGGDIKIIIPQRAIVEIVKLLDDDEDFIKVNIDKNMITLDMFHTKIATKLIVGDYINYRRIIPTAFESEISVEKNAFDQGIERAGIISREGNNTVILDVKEDVLTIDSKSEIGTIKENIKIKLEGKDIKIGFNVKYISDCLKNINDEFISINCNSPSVPVIIKQVDPDKLDYLFLVLPVRI